MEDYPTAAGSNSRQHRAVPPQKYSLTASPQTGYRNFKILKEIFLPQETFAQPTELIAIVFKNMKDKPPFKTCGTDILQFSEPQLSELQVLLQIRNYLFSTGHVQGHSVLPDQIYEGKD